MSRCSHPDDAVMYDWGEGPVHVGESWTCEQCGAVAYSADYDYEPDEDGIPRRAGATINWEE
jgi:hypothetical protein